MVKTLVQHIVISTVGSCNSGFLMLMFFRLTFTMVRFTVLITGERKDMSIYLCTTQIMTVFSEAFVVLIDL